MKKVFLLVSLLMGIFLISCVQTKQLEKTRAGQVKEKMKEYKEEGWKIDGTSRTLEIALLEHYEKIKSEDYQEMVGEVSSCISMNVCRQTAFNNAAIDYANKASTSVRGMVTADNNNDQSSKDGIEEFDKLYGAYERKLEAEIKKSLQESYSIVRIKGNGSTKEYQTYYLVNEKKASQARIIAMEYALKETETAQKYATKISQFVEKGFKIKNDKP